ncbi:histidinol-phosphate transaminase [Luteibacter aegosomatissinici]|uniref:histidinol-phosphate transaminase n=1 Tax=Luteibacter aegosomatissinici TaxID=2911539 RepID=UPI001FFA26F9|nr:histidinol-phosphate transaminase [Luteibacter aegosomatissinici]UPG95847.1 histidinol-phosphate transaminase [Luteibacter aegosomatissinici]
MSVLDLARPDIRALSPYSSARMEASGGTVLLNANESARPPSFPGGDGLNRYPDPQPRGLVDVLAELYDTTPDRVLVTRGSDEAIDLLTRAFCRAGQDGIVISPPTFGMYAVSARIQGAAVVEAPLEADGSLDADKLLAAVTPATKIVYVCTPNNPTGNLVPLATLERLAQALQGRALLVVDEAYAEFSGTPSATQLIDAYDHVAVLRTLSKAWSLAGARVGALVARAEVIGLLRRIIAPYPLPSPCVDAALAALSYEGRRVQRHHVHEILNERARMAVALATLPGVREVLPSHANFLAVRFDDAPGTYKRLLAAGVVVRDITKYPGLGDALRITIGTGNENDRVLAVLRAGVAA